MPPNPLAPDELSSLLGYLESLQMSDIPSTEQIQREEAADFVVRREALRRTWSRRPGFYGWLTDTNHKSVASEIHHHGISIFCNRRGSKRS